MVLIHGIKPTQVIGGAGRSNGMVVAAVITVPLMACGLALVMLVMIVMLMVLVVITFLRRNVQNGAVFTHCVNITRRPWWRYARLSQLVAIVLV